MTRPKGIVGIAPTKDQASVRPERVRHFIHYEKDTGLIRHLHTVFTFSRAHAKSDDQHWANAQRIAKRHNPKAQQLERLVLEGGEHPGRDHKIDPRTRTLVKA